MTDILGTEHLRSETNRKESEENMTPISVFNTSELKKYKATINNETHHWYDKRRYWLTTGIFVSLLFLLITIKYPRFWIFIPLGLITAFCAWHVKRLVNKYEPKTKRYSY